MLNKSHSKKSVYLFATLVVLGSIMAIPSMSANAVPYTHKWQDHKGWTFGPIASIQNNKEGKPAWILSGHWVTNIINKTKDSFNQTNPAKFDAWINMVMLNGSAMHNHKISNFSSDITNQDNVTTYKGTVTITMKDGPVKDVPVEIKVMDNQAIAISLDAAKTNNHFGDTPIYGTIVTKAEIATMMSHMGNRTKMGMMSEKGNMSMMHNSSSW